MLDSDIRHRSELLHSALPRRSSENNSDPASNRGADLADDEQSQTCQLYFYSDP